MKSCPVMQRETLCDIFFTFQDNKHFFDGADVAFNISVYGKSGVHRAEAADKQMVVPRFVYDGFMLRDFYEDAAARVAIGQPVIPYAVRALRIFSGHGIYVTTHSFSRINETAGSDQLSAVQSSWRE
ncbi:MAG: hypothetical protein IJK06_01365 [Clostridia bacterium]|nr:hypothetical protein [Clostridia bacterium]